MELRRTRDQDLPAAYDVFRAAIGELYERHRMRPPGPPLEVFISMQEHLLRTDGDRAHVAVEERRLVGFASSMARGGAWHLASLFILPKFQGQGLGRELLDRAWGDGYAWRTTLTDAIQPISNGMYARRGLIPAAPLLQLAGNASVSDLVPLEPSEPEPAAVASLDLAAYGFDRAVDHAYWSQQTAATLWRRDGEPLAYSYAWPSGRIGPLAGTDAESAALALTAALAQRGGAPAIVVAPGTAAPLIEAALAAGLKMQAPPGLLLLSRGAKPPNALAVSSYTLL